MIILTYHVMWPSPLYGGVRSDEEVEVTLRHATAFSDELVEHFRDAIAEYFTDSRVELACWEKRGL